MQDRLHIKDTVVEYDLWRKISAQDLRNGNIVNILQNDLSDKNLSLGNLSGYTWLFDCKYEGISSADIKPLENWMIAQGIPIKNFRVAFSCVEDVKELNYPAVSLPDRLITNGDWLSYLNNQNVDWLKLPMYKKMICLMRRPSYSRATLAKKILSNFDRNNIILSLGTNGGYCDPTIQKIISPYSFPLTVDSLTVNEQVQHQPAHFSFYESPINLVVETSDTTVDDTWHSIFITEKTFKCFGWYQFPIWYAVPGLVQQVRHFGFDVFDDLFDNHNYDNISDPWQRMDAVIELVKTVCNQNFNNLRLTHWERLKHNAQLVSAMYNQEPNKSSNILNRIKNVIF